MKRHLILAMATVMAASSISLISSAEEATSESAVAARSDGVRIGMLRGTRSGRYHVNMEERSLNNAYRSAANYARSTGRHVPSRNEFRSRVNQRIHEAVTQRYGNFVGANVSATILIIVSGDSIIIIIS